MQMNGIKKQVSLIFITLFIVILSCSQTEQLKEKALKIHQDVITIDSHMDTPLNLMRGNFDLAQRHEAGRSGGCFDLPRMKEGGLDVAFFAAFIGQGPRTAEGNQKAKDKVLSIINKIHESVNDNTEIVALAYSTLDIIDQAKQKKSTIVIGMENGYPLGQDITLLQKYYDLGVRYITLCHTMNNDICDSSTDEAGPEFNGLSDFGESVVKEMNQLGIMVDISHVSDETVLDVLHTSEAPVIASHSCAKALCDNPRNLNDSLLIKIAEKGGVVQMCLFSGYLKEIEQAPERKIKRDQIREQFGDYAALTPEERKEMFKAIEKLDQEYPQKLATISDLVDHIDHVVEVAGIDYVGIGSDFDGGGRIADCKDVSELPGITIELVKRGYNEEEIRKIWGGNFLRVFSEVENIAKL